MRAIARRIRKLETKMFPQVDPETYRWAMTIYERRRRRLEAEGTPITDEPPTLPTGPCLSWAEAILKARAERLAKARENDK